MYLNYDEYKRMGGSLETTAFNRNLRKSERLLNSWTFNRLAASQIDIQTIKDLLMEMVEKLGDGQKITSFSNDGISVNYAETNDEEELYNLVVECLPVELISIYLGG